METEDNISKQIEVTMANLRATADRFINSIQVKAMQDSCMNHSLYTRPLGEVDTVSSQPRATFQKITKEPDNGNYTLVENGDRSTTAGGGKAFADVQVTKGGLEATAVEDYHLECDDHVPLAEEQEGSHKDSSGSDRNSGSDAAAEKLEERFSEMAQQEPSHHARRPMNAFLIFCKRHRAVVRERYPTLENRAVTKILGEWWAGLDEGDKACYTALAKQYKDAFFNANPDFKWYKLPAPPLRSLTTRPGNAVRTIEFPQEVDDAVEDPKPEPPAVITYSSGFTPGKLADETQLGNLCSLIDPNFNLTPAKPASPPPATQITTHTLPDVPVLLHIQPNVTPISQCNATESNSLPKPPKKRFTSNGLKPDIFSAVSRNIFNSSHHHSDTLSTLSMPNNTPFINLRNHALHSTQTIHERQMKRLHAKRTSTDSDDSEKCDDGGASRTQQIVGDRTPVVPDKAGNMTQQELIDRIVDHSMCSDVPQHECIHEHPPASTLRPAAGSGKQNGGSVRKSGRSCKGKRYAEFMTEGRLVVNKRGRKTSLMMRTGAPKKSKHKHENTSRKTIGGDVGPLRIFTAELDTTIQKLVDRTVSATPVMAAGDTDIHGSTELESPEIEFRKRTISDASDDSITKKMFRAADFNLDEKIEALPSLSLEKFQQRKKENKKRKKMVHISKPSAEKNAGVKKFKTTVTLNMNNNNNNDEFVNQVEANNNSLIGSRKRKARKESITHLLEPSVPLTTGDTAPAAAGAGSDLDLFNLATLAEVAVKLGGCP